MSVIQTERTPQIAKMAGAITDLQIEAHDPSTKPETAKAIAQIWTDHDKLGGRIDRLEERFNNFHQFLLQTRPPNLPLGRRGEGPFRLDERG